MKMELLFQIKCDFFEKIVLWVFLVVFSSMTFAQERVMVIADPHVLASSLMSDRCCCDGI